MVKRAMVLAAGYGERLRPLTDLTPKPLMPVCNRPVIEGPLRLLRRHGVRQVVINLHHRGQAIKERLGDGGRLGLEINYSPEETILGTAGGIKAAERFLGDGPFLVINGDILIDLDLEEVSRFHKEKGAAVTLVLREEEASAYGVIKIDDDNRVVQFLRTASGDERHAAVQAMFTGVQILEPSLLELIPPGVPWGTSENLYPQLLEEGEPVYGYVMKGAWVDIGTPRCYLEANFMALENPSLLETEVTGETGEGITDQGGLKLDEGVGLRPPVHLGEGCMLEKGSVAGPGVVMGSRCSVGPESRISNSVIWDGVEIGGDSIIVDSIVCGDVIVPPSGVIEGKMVVRNEDGSLNVRSIV